jgi:nitrate reductase cytochrome c-type subunit
MSANHAFEVYVDPEEPSPENYFKKITKPKPETLNKSSQRPRSAIRFSKITASNINKQKLPQTPSKTVERTENPNRKLSSLEIENIQLKASLSKTQNMLKTALKKLSKGPLTEDVFQEYLRQGLYISYLEKELEKFKVIFEASHGMSRNKLLISKMSEKIKQLESHNKDLNEELLKSKRGTFFMQSKVNQADVVPIVEKVFQACCRLRLSIDELGYVINPNGLETLSIHQINTGFRAVDCSANLSDIKYLLQVIIGYEVESISQSRLIQGLKFFNKSCEQYENLKPFIETLRLAFAAAEMDKPRIKAEFECKSFNSISFKNSLLQSGLVVDPSVITKVFHSLFSESEEKKAEEMIETLFQMFDRKFLTKEQEEELKDQVKLEMVDKWDKFIENCQETDIETLSEISFDDFSEILHKLQVELSEAAEEYLKVFFYSKTGKAGRVAYVNFYLSFKD